MAKSRQVIMRQTITITATFTVAFTLFCSVILNSAISTAISLCCYQYAEEDPYTDSCCSGIGTSPDCCCNLSIIPNKNDTIEPFGKSINSYICAVHTFDNSDFIELYNINFETQNNPEYFVFKIFRPPKA